MVSAQTKTCSIHVNALNDYVEWLCQTEHINTVIHKDCYTEIWCSVKNSCRTSLPQYDVTERHPKPQQWRCPGLHWLWSPDFKKMACIHIYLKSVLSCKFLILDTYHLDTLNLHEQGCEEPIVSCQPKDQMTNELTRHWLGWCGTESQ
jgi:hypothetical protein